MNDLLQITSEELETIKKICSYLARYAYANYDIKEVMLKDGYDASDINTESKRRYISSWKKEDLESYTRFKIEQGKTFYANELLRKMITGQDLSTFKKETDTALYNYYIQEVHRDLTKILFPEDDRISVSTYFINKNLEKVQSFLVPFGENVEKERYRKFVIDFVRKQILQYVPKEEIENMNINFNDTSIENYKKILSSVKGVILDNDAPFIGDYYYAKYKPLENEVTDEVSSTNKNKKDILTALKKLKELGIELTAEQEKMLNVLHMREEVQKRVEYAKKESQKINEERLSRQNDPNHPDNVRKRALEKSKLIVENLSSLNHFGMLSFEQIQKLDEYTDFILYSRDVDEQNIGPMSEEVRKKMTEYYTDMTTEVKQKKLHFN